MTSRHEIAEQLLRELLGHGVALDGGGYCECPGRAQHHTGNGRKDFRVFGLDPSDPIPPTMFCLHKSCGDVIDAANREFRRRIWFAENRAGDYAPRGHWAEGVASAPKAETKTRPELDMASVWEFTHGVPEITPAWCQRRSPIDVEGVESGDFLNALYQPGERVLVFTDQRSQGDFLWVASAPGGAALVGGDDAAAGVATHAGDDDERRPAAPEAAMIDRPPAAPSPMLEHKLRGGFRLAQERNVRAVPSRLPPGAKEGVWFLVQPVTGLWVVKADVVLGKDEAQRFTREVQGKFTRRSQGNVSRWVYFVLESDELPAEDWLKVLAQLALPIAAIYTSGGRSIHALLKMEVPSKPHWDMVRNEVRKLVCPLGADPAALTAVRLSRLPGCKRGERMQELIYLNPEPEGTPLRLLRELR